MHQIPCRGGQGLARSVATCNSQLEASGKNQLPGSFTRSPNISPFCDKAPVLSRRTHEHTQLTAVMRAYNYPSILFTVTSPLYRRTHPTMPVGARGPCHRSYCSRPRVFKHTIREKATPTPEVVPFVLERISWSYRRLYRILVASIIL